MKTVKKLIIPALVIVVAVVLVSWLWVFKKADDSVANQKAELEIEASQIVNQFENNEDSANKQYLGKVIIVSGVLESVKENKGDFSLYLKSDDAMSGVLCSFNKSSIDKSKLQTGQPVKIKGICTGYLIDVVLNKCVLVK